MIRVYLLSLLFFFSSLHAGTTDSARILQELNNQTLKFYNQTIREINFYPIIVVQGDHLTFLNKKNRINISIIPSIYTELKTYAHLSLGIFSLYQQKNLDIATLKSYRNNIKRAQKVLSTTHLTQQQQKRQNDMIQFILQSIDETLAKNSVDINKFHQLSLKIKPLLWQNVQEAAVAQLQYLNQKLNQIKKQLPVQEWERINVVVLGPHMPRENNLLIQYFKSQLHLADVNDRLVYGEGLTTETEALELMSRIKLDTKLGLLVLDDKYRMHRDLLGDAAKDYFTVDPKTF